MCSLRMEKYPVKVINNGRVTIPAEVRREMELENGDYVVITVEEFEQ